MNARRLLERVAFSLVILAVWLFYEAYQIYTHRAPGTTGRIAAYTVIGALLLGVGFAGIRLRHRPRD